MRKWIFASIALLITAIASAESSPEGLWMSFDDDGNTPTALVRITKSNNRYSGRIEKILDPKTSPESICSKCSDDRKNQPLIGLEIIKDAKVGAQSGQWRDGKILDPDDGQEYKLIMSLQDNGRLLEVKGYWGLFWRTQHWQKQIN